MVEKSFTHDTASLCSNSIVIRFTWNRESQLFPIAKIKLNTLCKAFLSLSSEFTNCVMLETNSSPLLFNELMEL